MVIAIAIAFARTPMTLANVGWDLQTLTGGRFVLGLGSQIQPHVEQRYSMPWSKPKSTSTAAWQTTKEPCMPIRGCAVQRYCSANLP